MLRRRAAITGCALAIIALASTAVPVAAQLQRAETLSAHKPPPGLLEALQRDLHLSAEQAQTRLLNEIRLTPIAAQLRRRLGIRFAGSWLLPRRPWWWRRTLNGHGEAGVVLRRWVVCVS
jgi:hypothetical protein